MGGLRVGEMRGRSKKASLVGEAERTVVEVKEKKCKGIGGRWK